MGTATCGASPAALGGAVHASADAPALLAIELTVRDREVLDELLAHPEGPPRQEFANAALRIGVLALKHARGRIDADLVRNECDRMLESLEGQLRTCSQSIHERLNQSLADYFDPKGGRFHERITRLIQKDGELESLLRRQIGGDDSEMCKTLARHVGEQSPLMKILDPNQSAGLLRALSETLTEELAKQREKLLREFSLDDKESALSRLVAELSNNHGEISDKLQEQIHDVVKEFDLNNENSGLHRLVANVERAQRTITGEFSLDNDSSALSRLKREVLELIREQTDQNTRFQQDVRAALAALTARRAEAELSTQHGRDFEDAVWQFLWTESQKAGDLIERTGTTTGLIKYGKKGDAVIELGPETIAAGARIVVEAKAEAGYSLAKARDELDEARKNRGASVGLFVFARRNAPQGLDALSRYGSDVFVIWDQDDPQSDVYLRAALTVARAIAVRDGAAKSAPIVDWSALDATVLEFEKRVNSLEEITKSAETIQHQAENIMDRVRKLRKALDRQVKVLVEQIAGVKAIVGADGGDPS
jgi:hypothetical protein